MSKRIEELVNIHGVSGFEGQVKSYLKTNFGEVSFIEDNVGGIATCIDSGKPGNNILVLAHMDEVGFMLKNIKDNGICKITPLGGFVPESVVNSHVIAITEDGQEYEGIILGESPHGNGPKQEMKVENFNIDFGFTSKEQAIESGFELGIQVALKNDYTKLANNRVSSKAFDNRLGCAAILDLFDELNGNLTAGKLYLAASVQEEVGLRGASPMIHAIEDKIDYAMIIDVSPVKDLDEVTNGTIGAGTLIRVQDPRTVLTVSEVRHLRKLAKENDIDNQDFFSAGGTDANVIQITGSGVKTCALCVPGRNLHTQNSVISLDDYDSTLKLAKKYIESRLTNE
ncbi:M20/M25/M40 family metallo-hydrolase [Mollicutes bacterium LVI A0078]|nr:M20/M25/M40 family metallo-hydrolase [Mollicutes bacterium LVI A0075]WOO90699.1 M20/M25/M40 family metallo-hydrolase [Mollicutes bacterium LVI A0078]